MMKISYSKKEAEYIKKIFDWFIIDNLNYSDIAKNLNELGVVKGEASRSKIETFLNNPDLFYKSYVLNNNKNE